MKNWEKEQALIDAANLLHEAAGRLPDGYSITLAVDNFESSIEITTPDGDEVEPDEVDHNYSAWSAAIDAAIEHAASMTEKESDV